MQGLTDDPTTPSRQRCMALTQARFRLFPIRSPLLWESLLFSFPSGTEMVQFPEFPPSKLYIRFEVLHKRAMGSPIQKSADQGMLATPRSLSQLATSFIGIWHLGIHRAPLTIYSY